MATTMSYPAGFQKRAKQADTSTALTGIQAVAMLLEQSKRYAAQSTFTETPKTKEQAFVQMLKANPQIYASYKTQKATLAFRFQAGDASAAQELLTLQGC